MTLSSTHGVQDSMNPKTSPGSNEQEAPLVIAGTIESTEAADNPSRRRVWSEVLAATLLPAFATALLSPADPLLIRGNFPWLVLVPVLVGVQHGAWAASSSSGLLLATGGIQALLASRSPFMPGGTATSELAAFAGGCLAAGIIAGHFHDRVQARLSQLSLQAADAARRLSRLARTHAVVTLSHRRLEERLAAGRWSLVSAFEEARRELSRADGLSSAGELVLDVLANHALVQSATFLGVASARRDGRLVLEPCARIGNAPVVDLRHRLLQRALAAGRVVAIDAEALDAEAEQSVLAVAPLVASSGTVLGAVVIHELPFMAFQADGLKGLAALTALLADMLEDHPALARPDEQRPALAPERALRALAAPADRVPAGALPADDLPAGDLPAGDLPADDLPADDLPADETPESGDVSSGAVPGQRDVAGNDAFVGTRTGTHRRRGVAQSA
jgi:polysaccharide biosynthesis protein PelD